jgi:hypothetical protein
MKTTSYNPSSLEIELAQALVNLQSEIEKHLSSNRVRHISSDLSQDNPVVKLHLTDKDGDAHEIVIKIVQIPDKP